MADIASLSLKVDSSQVKQATVELKQMGPAATAAERAVAKWGMTSDAAAKSADDFSKRVQSTIKSLEFERAQLTRSAAEQEKYAAIRRAGVSALSAEGKAIAASVDALQAQRAAAASSNATAQSGVGLFGQITDKIKGYGAALTVAALATAALAKGREIVDYALTIDKLAKSLKISTSEAQALDAASRQTGKSAEDLNTQLSASQKLLLTNVFKSAFGDTSKTVESVASAANKLTDAWNDMAEAGKQGAIAMFGDLTVGVLNALTAAINGWSAAVSAASGVLSRVASSSQMPSVAGYQADPTGALTTALGGMATDTSAMASDQDILREKIDNTRGSIAKLQDELTKARDEMARDGDRAGLLSVDIANFEARVASLTVRLSELLPQLKALAAATTQPMFGAAQGPIPTFQGAGPNIIAPGAWPGASQITRWQTEGLKAPVTGGGGSSAGRSDNDSVDAQIKRYEALADVAKRAGDTIAANRAKNIDDLQREVRVQEQVEEVAAKLGAKYADADQARKDQLRNEIALYEQRKSANQVALESAQKAEDMEVKLGDGTRARALLERDLARAQDTGRVSAEALLRVEKQRTEELTQSALAAQRYDDNLGSLVAGYEHAANAARRSNDLFSQGVQLYDLGREALGGFVADLRQGLMDGASVWESFGNAATNALGKISDKLMEMALNQLWAAAFPSGGGGGGGIGGGLFGIIGSIFGGGAAGGLGGGSGMTFANGGRTPVGVPYMVGERGPEVRIDGQPGQIFNRSQWNGMGGGERQRVEIVLMDDMLDARIAEGSNVQIVRATPRLVGTTLDRVPGKMSQHQRDVAGGDYRLG